MLITHSDNCRPTISFSIGVSRIGGFDSKIIAMYAQGMTAGEEWKQVIPFFAYPLEIRKIIYTTNAIESLHMQLRKVLKNEGIFLAMKRRSS